MYYICRCCSRQGDVVVPFKLLVTLLLAVAAVVVATTRGADAEAQNSGNPLEGVRFFVDRESPSWQEYEALRRSGQTAKADLIWKIAREPKNLWIGSFTRPNFEGKVRDLLDRAGADGAVPLFTVLRAESTQCNATYQGGGPAEDAATRRWYDDLARVIGDRQVVIGFEPDSLGTIDCHAPNRRDDRIKLLRYGVTALSRLPNATVYVEAGASDWEPAARVARKLRAIGIAKVRGFMLNATHYDWTRSNIRYGLQISRMTGGKHFVINTAENGRGPVHRALPNGRRQTVWCNPGFRGLGPAPTTDTSHPKVDAYLWINRPGYAQSCQGRQIGWFLPRALSYARWATDWEGPPKGTRHGHHRRLTPRQLNIPR
jgi:endoglucanase